MDKIMGGQVLDYETKEIYRQGLEDGKIIARFEDGMSVDAIAEKSKVSVEEVKSVLKKEGLI